MTLIQLSLQLNRLLKLLNQRLSQRRLSQSKTKTQDSKTKTQRLRLRLKD